MREEERRVCMKYEHEKWGIHQTEEDVFEEDGFLFFF